MSRLLLIAAVLAAASPALADEPPEEMVVYGDPFLRWDDTRWLVETDVLLPWPMRWLAAENWDFRAAGFQAKVVLQCSKANPLGTKQYEVDCLIEDVSLNAIAAEKKSWRFMPWL